MSSSRPQASGLRSKSQEKKERRILDALKSRSESSSFCIRYSRKPALDPETGLYYWSKARDRAAPSEYQAEPSLIHPLVFDAISKKYGFNHGFKSMYDANAAADQCARIASWDWWLKRASAV